MTKRNKSSTQVVRSANFRIIFIFNKPLKHNSYSTCGSKDSKYVPFNDPCFSSHPFLRHSRYQIYSVIVMLTSRSCKHSVHSSSWHGERAASLKWENQVIPCFIRIMYMVTLKYRICCYFMQNIMLTAGGGLGLHL